MKNVQYNEANHVLLIHSILSFLGSRALPLRPLWFYSVFTHISAVLIKEQNLTPITFSATVLVVRCIVNEHFLVLRIYLWGKSRRFITILKPNHAFTMFNSWHVVNRGSRLYFYWNDNFFSGEYRFNSPFPPDAQSMTGNNYLWWYTCLYSECPFCTSMSEGCYLFSQTLCPRPQLCLMKPEYCIKT